MSLRYFSHAFDAVSNASGEMPLSPPTLSVCLPSVPGSGRSTPCSRMHSANLTCARRSSSSSGRSLPAVAAGSPPPHAAIPSAATVSRPAAMGRRDIWLLSGGVTAMEPEPAESLLRRT